jgi:hypothetical protein
MFDGCEPLGVQPKSDHYHEYHVRVRDLSATAHSLADSKKPELPGAERFKKTPLGGVVLVIFHVL